MGTDCNMWMSLTARLIHTYLNNYVYRPICIVYITAPTLSKRWRLSHASAKKSLTIDMCMHIKKRLRHQPACPLTVNFVYKWKSQYYPSTNSCHLPSLFHGDGIHIGNAILTCLYPLLVLTASCLPILSRLPQ